MLIFLFCLLHSFAGKGYDLKEVEFVVGPPPVEQSEAYLADFVILHRYQDDRTPAECKAADAQSIPSVSTLFKSKHKLDGLLTDSEISLVVSFGGKLLATADDIVTPFKKKYGRLRPYDEDPELKPCIFKPLGNRAYPSGHAAMGLLLAKVFSKIFTDKADDILKQGIQIGTNRILGGVHHPSDVEAGQALAEQIFNALQVDQEYVEDLKALLPQKDPS